MKNKNLYFVDDDKFGGVEFKIPAYSLSDLLPFLRRFSEKETTVWLPHGLLIKLMDYRDHGQTYYRFKILEGPYKDETCKININEWRDKHFPALEYNNKKEDKAYDLIYSMAHNLRGENRIRSYPFNRAFTIIDEPAQIDLDLKKEILTLHNFNNYSHPDGLKMGVALSKSIHKLRGKYEICLPDKMFFQNPIEEGFMERRNIHFKINSEPNFILVCEQEIENSISCSSYKWRDLCKHLLIHRKNSNILGEISIQ